MRCFISVIATLMMIGGAVAATPPRVTGVETSLVVSAGNSLPTRTATAECPPGKQIVGGGGTLSGDASAQAHEAPGGYPYDWRLMAFAICADTPVGYHVVYGDSPQHGAEPVEGATAECPAQILSAGAALASNAPGNATIQSVNPLDYASVIAVASTPTSVPWGGVVAQAICVD